MDTIDAAAIHEAKYAVGAFVDENPDAIICTGVIELNGQHGGADVTMTYFASEEDLSGPGTHLATIR